MPDNISGTVIQRSFIGRGITNVIHVATVPCDELGISDGNFETVIADLLGVPCETILSERDYFKVADKVAHSGPDFPWILRGYSYLKQFKQMRGVDLEVPKKTFLGDFISLISRSSAPTALNSIVLLNYADFIMPDVNADAFDLAMLCLSTRFQPRPDAALFYDEMLAYDIPLGQSPKTKSDSLLTLLENSKGVCLAPLAVGGSHGITLLSQGNYVAALKTTGTAGAMTLILIGTVSVGSIIVQRVAQHRRNSDKKIG